MSSQNAVSWLVQSHLSHKKTRQTRPSIITNYSVINLSTYFNSQLSWQVTRVIAACSILQWCSAACSIAFNIVAWTKLMTLTNESTYFAFQMIWGEIVNLFLFPGVPGWCCPSGGDLSQEAKKPGPATLHAGVAADHWSPVRRGWSSAWPQQPPSLEQFLPDSSLTGDAAKPHLLPSALAPTFSRSQLQEKLQPRNHLLQWAPKLTQNRICGLMNYIQTVGFREAVFVIIHNLPIVDYSRHLWKLLFQ